MIVQVDCKFSVLSILLRYWSCILLTVAPVAILEYHLIPYYMKNLKIFVLSPYSHIFVCYESLKQLSSPSFYGTALMQYRTHSPFSSARQGFFESTYFTTITTQTDTCTIVYNTVGNYITLLNSILCLNTPFSWCCWTLDWLEMP